MSNPWKEFQQQKANARRRSIDWELTFDEWWKIWEDSGLYHARGRRGFVMHRYGDDGPYAIGNVEIVSAAHNFRQAMDAYYCGGRNYL